ncbi:hypothetical protein ACFX19_000353 [Malus domestica]
MDSLLEFDYPTSVHTISGSGACNDSVVPVQPDPIPPPSFNMNYNVSGPADHNCFDLDFFRSKLYSSFNTGSDDLHMTSELRKSFSPYHFHSFPKPSSAHFAISSCKQLTFLNLSMNHFNGPIPVMPTDSLKFLSL